MKQFSEEQYRLEKSEIKQFSIKRGTIKAKLGEVDSDWKVILDSSDENGIQVSNNHFRYSN